MGVSFIRAQTPFIRAPLSLLNHLPKVPLPNSVTLGVIRLLTYEFGVRETDIQRIPEPFLSLW